MDNLQDMRHEAADQSISPCGFCLANVWGPDGWAKFGITNAKLNDLDRSTFSQDYEAIFQNLLDSAQHGCWWCGQVSNGVLRAELERSEVLYEDRETSFPIRIQLSFGIPRGRQPRRLGLLTADISWGSDEPETCIGLSFGMFSQLNEPAQQYFLTRSSHDSEQESFNSTLARKWLNDCMQTHSCSRYGANCPPPLPHRVLNVKNELQIQLQFPQDSARSNYVCLSYAWGGPQPLILTASSQSSLQTGIGSHEFPPTIRDAIHTTRELGFEYLWIDALCILQDSDEDKNAELKKMHRYYHYATLCIQPTGVRSVHDHFLSRQFDHGPRRRSVDVLNHLDLDPTTTIIFHSDDGLKSSLIIENDPMIYKENWDPLHERAWVLQERLLSHRLLIFPQAKGLVWQCEEVETYDGVIYSRSGDQGRYRLPAADTKNIEDVMGQWYKLASDYSRRRLTCSDDKFIAIAALVELFSNRWGQELGMYCAGHWSNFLPQSLLWCSRSYRSGHPNPNLAVAPTWSWASCHDGVYWPNDIGTAYRCEVLDCKIELSNPEHQFGAVNAGTLRLNCLTTAARIQTTSPLLYQGDLLSELYTIDGSQTRIGIADLEIEGDIENLEPIMVTLVHVDSNHGLIVTEHTAGTHIRIGWFLRETDHADFDSTQTVITLV
ncbi:hypothetical protein Vi05172_g6459 [Venturia inaequalis]|nr:hypothetical protein Vi05172_g6459 [Venturia inaequalis]